MAPVVLFALCRNPFKKFNLKSPSPQPLIALDVCGLVFLNEPTLRWYVVRMHGKMTQENNAGGASAALRVASCEGIIRSMLVMACLPTCWQASFFLMATVCIASHNALYLHSGKSPYKTTQTGFTTPSPNFKLQVNMTANIRRRSLKVLANTSAEGPTTLIGQLRLRLCSEGGQADIIQQMQ